MSKHSCSSVALKDELFALVEKNPRFSADLLKNLFSTLEPSSPLLLHYTRTICSQYLGGTWSRADPHAFKLKPISGGMSNLLFLVELMGDSRVLMRINCQAEPHEQLVETVVFSILSERCLGPRLYGVFPGGRFEEFIPSRSLSCKEISQPRFAALIAPLLARVHTLNVPISKDVQLMVVMRSWLEKFALIRAGQKPIQLEINQSHEIDEFPLVVTYADLRDELTFIDSFLVKYQSPVVFSHNDLQEGNILLVNGSKEKGSDDDKSLTLIDFEYCNYNYRGFDLGNHFCEYGYDYSNTEPPFYHIHKEKFNVVNERRIFCQAYLKMQYRMKEMDRHFPSHLLTGNIEADLERLIEETIIFMPIANIFWAIWSLLQSQESVLRFDFWSYAHDRLRFYYKQKRLLVDAYAKL